jgi:predicted transcriptional regulator
MKPVSATLTPQELEIMKIVWRLEKATVREVYEVLLERRRIAYTTVMTMMKILEKKKRLVRRLEDKVFVYAPAVPGKQVIREMVREFVDRVFNGAAEPLVAHLVEDRRLSERDLRAIASMIRNSEGSKR